MGQETINAQKSMASSDGNKTAATAVRLNWETEDFAPTELEIHLGLISTKISRLWRWRGRVRMSLDSKVLFLNQAPFGSVSMSASGESKN